VTRIETLRALLVLKQPQLLDRLKVELNGAEYIFRAVRTPEGVTVRFGSRFADRDLGELLPRVAEAALSALLDEARAALLREEGVVRQQLAYTREMSHVLARNVGLLEAWREQDSWSTSYLAAQFLLQDAAKKERVLAQRYAELGDLLHPSDEEDA
jgi:hypothetical protein